VIEHLTDAELREFTGGSLMADDLLRADDHLSACDRCRARAIGLSDAARQIDELHSRLNTRRHLTDEELQLFVQRRLPADGNNTVVAHLQGCATCATQLEELRSWAEAPDAGSSRTAQRFPNVRWGWLGVAAAILLAVLIPVAIWQARSGRQPTSPSILGLEALAPADQERVRSALNAGAATLPDFMSDVTTSREVLMGPSAMRGDTFDLVAPIGTATVSDRPRFEWQPFEHAQGYTVAVFDEQSSVVSRSAIVAETHWIPNAPLARGRTYVWQVAAHRAGDTITAPAAPAPAAKFHVIDASSAAVLERMEAERPQAHLLLGILNMQAGVREMATSHLRQVQLTEAYGLVAERSLERLEATTKDSGRSR
jgi:hypothetical protein